MVLCLLNPHKYIQTFTKSAKILNSKSLPHPRNQTYTKMETRIETKIETELKADLQEAREIWVQSCKDNDPFELQKIYEKIYNDCVSVWKSYVNRIPDKSSEEESAAITAIESAAETDIFSKPREEAEEILLNEIIRLKNKIAFNSFVYRQHDTDSFQYIFDDNRNIYDRILGIQWALEKLFALDEVADVADTESEDVFPEMNLEVD